MEVVAVKVAPVLVEAGAVKVVPVDRAGQVVGRAASASISARRKSASFVSRKST